MTVKRAIPSWVVGLVIIVTAIITLFAVVKTQSAVAWTPQGAPEAPKSFSQIFFPGIAAIQQTWSDGQAQPAAPAPAPTPVPTIVAGSMPGHTERGTCTGCHNVVSSRGQPIPQIQVGSKPPHDDRGLCTNCHQLAAPTATLQGVPSDVRKGGTGQLPTIVAGAVPMHGDRGACATCHQVVTSRGVPVPAIPTNARRPHDNRGLCTNCHDILGAGQAAGLGQATAPSPLTMVAAAMPMTQPALPAAQPAMPAAEGGWNGIEVTPVTALTATQYGIPHGTVGLIVAEAEGGAAVAGIRAGDVVLGVNGAPTPTLAAFFRATANGTVARGTVEILRKGQPMTAVVDSSLTAPQAAQPAPVAMAPQTVAAAMAIPAPTTAPPPPEGEWLGLEVAPISSMTATQYNLPPGLTGLLVAEAEAQAAAIGVKAGDVLQYVNGVPTTDVTRFFLATKNGTLPKGTIVLWRKGEQIVTNLSQTSVAPPAAAPVAPVANAAPVAQWSPYGQTPPNWAAYPQVAAPSYAPNSLAPTPVGNVVPAAGAGQAPCYRQF